MDVVDVSRFAFTLKVMAPVTVVYQAWAYWVFRQRISADRIPLSIGLARRPS